MWCARLPGRCACVAKSRERLRISDTSDSDGDDDELECAPAPSQERVHRMTNSKSLALEVQVGGFQLQCRNTKVVFCMQVTAPMVAFLDTWFAPLVKQMALSQGGSESTHEQARSQEDEEPGG